MAVRIRHLQTFSKVLSIRHGDECSNLNVQTPCSILVNQVLNHAMATIRGKSIRPRKVPSAPFCIHYLTDVCVWRAMPLLRRLEGKHSRRWTGYTTLPLGLNKCMLGALSWTVIEKLISSISGTR